MRPVVAVAISLAVLGLVAFLVWHPGEKLPDDAGFPKAPPPAYEDLGRLSLEEKVRRADVGVFAALDDLDADASQVHFEVVKKKRKLGLVWEYAEIRVGLRGRAEPKKIERLLTGRLASEVEGLSIKVAMADRSRVRADVIIEGMVTHRLTFGPVKPFMPRRQKMIPVASIVLDDVGHDIRLAQAFMELHPAISISVLPGSPFGEGIAKRAQALGRDVLLHVPMEPYNGKFARAMQSYLSRSMSPEQIESALAGFIYKIPQAVGVNNHMGSSFTEDPEKMRVVLNYLKTRGLFFLDSRTSSHSQGYRVARELGLKSAERDVFLDHIEDPHSIQIQIERFIALARRKGRSIAIIHPHKVSLEVLRREIERIEREGIMLVPVSAIVG
jgi:polysaccharide deacetylase 2 family uncharacterized protein YibQ